MARVKTGKIRRQKHKKILKSAKSFKSARSRRVRVANETVLKAGAYAYAGRKLKKRQSRRLWITRLSAALKDFNLSYSQFIKLLENKKIKLNRKILSQIAVNHPKAFDQVVKELK